VSFGGPVDWKTGRVILSHHVAGWEDIALVGMLRERYGVPAAMDNDANTAALGEWRFGAGRGCQSLLYITVSTGIGGGWVLGGEVYRGVDSMAGEIGHLAVDPDGPECVCGKRGCVEAIGSGTAIAAYMARLKAPRPEAARTARLKAGKGSRLEAARTAEEVNQWAEAGDPAAIEVMARAARALGIGIGYAITLINPDRVVIGGGVAEAGQVYWRTLRETASRYVLPQMRVEVVKAGLGGESPLWGAAALAESVFKPPAT
jgi:glucokinase